MSAPFPGSPDDMMNTIAALRARVAELEASIEILTGGLLEATEKLARTSTLRVRIAKLEAAVRGSLIQNSGEGEWADVRRDGQRSQLAATIDAMEAALSETVEA